MKDKKTLITIIVLLIIFLPLTVIGTINHFKGAGKTTVEDENVNKDFIFNNKVYFYQDGVLSSTYECDNCGVSEPILDDANYHTNSYQSGTKEFNPILGDGWALFKKGDKEALYNLIGKNVVFEYQAVKSYKVDTESNILISRSGNKWGVSFLDMSATGIKNNYDYIALPAHFTNDVLETSKFIGQINNKWYILDSNSTNAVIGLVENEIVDFNDNYYITYNDGSYKVMDYNNVEHLVGNSFKNIYAVGKYIFAVTTSNILFIYENCDMPILKNTQLPEYKEIYFSKNDNGIAIMIDKKLHENIELS